MIIREADLAQFCQQPDRGYCKPGKHGASLIKESDGYSCQYWLRNAPRLTQLPTEVPTYADGTPLCP